MVSSQSGIMSFYLTTRFAHRFRHALVTAVALIALILTAPSAWGQHEDIRREINKIIRYDTDISYDEIPGFVVGIIDGDSTFVLPFGEVRSDSAMRASSMLFEIGGVTKVFTSSLLSVMQDRGLLSLSDGVNQHLPPAYRNPRMENLTIDDLLTHSSGFPKRPKYFGLKEKVLQNPYAYYTKQDLGKFYREYLPRENNYGAFMYSHLNYALLELVVEHVSAMSYEKALRHYILEPLALDDTFLSFSEDRFGAMAYGHDRARKRVSPWRFASFAASEGLKSDMEDLAEFVRSQFGDSRAALNGLFDINHRKAYRTDFNKHIFAGKGWYVVDNKGYTIITHSGKTSGHYCFIGFVKNTKTGVIILANSSLGTHDLGFLILRMINYNWNRKA